nr:hypothetical protein [Tanacetum cinerariifolium]
MQMGRFKVNKGCRVMTTGIMKKNCVYTLEAKVMSFGVHKHGGSNQVGLKQLGFKKVGFKQLGHKQVGFKQLGPGVETGVHGVQVEKRVWFEVELQGAQGDRKAEVFQVGANITVTGVPGQEGVEGNVAEKKKVKESIKANLEKLLNFKLSMDGAKYKLWRTIFLDLCICAKVSDHITCDPPIDEDWISVDAKIKTWYYNSVEANLLQNVIKEKCTAKNLWDNIEEFFTNNKMSRALQLKEIFCNTKKGLMSVTEYYHTLKSLVDSLVDLDGPVSETELVMKILRLLPSSYNSMKDIITNTKPFPTFVNARNMLLLHVSRDEYSEPHNEPIVTRSNKYSELSDMEAIQADCDVKATNIILQGLPPEERECKLYDEFDKFAYNKGETLREFYLRFSLLLNDMNIYNMKMEQFQVNTKFLNTLPP